jgi:KipI family sensor histidine kinase inhibitor
MEYTLETLGEDALLLRFGNEIDATANDRVHALAQQIEQLRPPWLRDLVPAYASLALFVDANGFDDAALDPLAEAQCWLQRQAFVFDDVRIAGRLIEIPVHYGGRHGPDLADVAAHAGLAGHEVIARHCEGVYRVAMLGFAPGFPYLLGLDPRLAMPRLDTPRTRVEAGSVGIGGAQTGIYPQAGPGGWRIIGRTTCSLFDPARDPPTLLTPGDRVRFVAATGET